MTDAQFAPLQQHWSDGEIVELLGVVAMFAFLNRWYDTMPTPLEMVPEAVAVQALGARCSVLRAGSLASTASENSLPANRHDVHAAPRAGERDFAFLHRGLQLHAAFGQRGQRRRRFGG